MTAPQALPEIPNGTLLQGSSHRGGGNLLYVVDGKRILKLYRRRRARWRAPWRDLGQWMEGKRGVRPEERRRVECESLELWKREGFDVPACYEDTLPDGIDQPALWLEYCPGPSLFDLVRDADTAMDRKRDCVRRFAGDLARRQARALQLGDPRLSHEHPSVLHVLVHEDRLVSFDLETAFKPSYDVEMAVEQELAGVVRSLFRAVPEDGDTLTDAFILGYDDSEVSDAIGQLETIARRGLATRGLKRRLRHLRFMLRPRRMSKLEGLRAVLRALDRRSR